MKIIRHPLFMSPHPDEELEHLIDRELRRLPDRPAPDTLMPRVFGAIAARQALPWWRKSFAYWPVSARLVFLAGSTALAAMLGYLVWGVSSGVSLGALGAEIRPWLSGFGAARSVVETLATAVVIMARSAGPWLMWSAVSIATVSYLTTIGLGTVCWRLATRRE